jgi:hypothetical protein
MAETRRLKKFSISQVGRDYVLHIEDEGGAKFDLSADDDQLGRIIDELDDALNGPPIEDGG